jgi:hypothetical protein
MLENPADPSENGGPLRVLAEKLALDAPKADVVFLALAASAPAQWTSPDVS